jgi:hypothetical protein
MILDSEEVFMKVVGTSDVTLANLQRELCQFEKQLVALRDSVRGLIEATGTNRQVISSTQESELATRIADGVLMRLNAAAHTTSAHKKYVREREAADYMGVSVAALRSWRLRRSKNGPPFTRLGKMVLYSVAELERHMEARLVPSRD